METMTKKRPGLLVLTRKGRKGRTYSKEDKVNGKVVVHIIDTDFRPTGEKVLCDEGSLQVRGSFD